MDYEHPVQNKISHSSSLLKGELASNVDQLVYEILKSSASYFYRDFEADNMPRSR